MNSIAINKIRSWVEIDLARLRNNFIKVANQVDPCGVIAVVKANAYGLGAVKVAEALVDAGASMLGVADAAEAMEVRGFPVPVAVLSGTIPVERAILVENDIIMPVSDLADARDINHVAQALRRKARVQIKVDTGMGRLGINLPEAYEAIRLIAGMDKLELLGICSHFPLSSEGGEGFANRQIKEFTDLLGKLAEDGITFKWRHIANSDAICNFPAAFQPPFNMVRSGINLYGAFNQNNIDKLQLEPAVSFKSRLIAVRDLPAGSNIGYGLQCQLNDRTSVGIVAAGYADGVPLALSGKGNVLIRGTVCPILGRISMDYTAVSLAALPTAQVGDEVVLLGSSGKYQIGVQEWAHYKNTHPYEILCSFGTRARRCYIDDRQLANDSGMLLAESRLS